MNTLSCVMPIRCGSPFLLVSMTLILEYQCSKQNTAALQQQCRIRFLYLESCTTTTTPSSSDTTHGYTFACNSARIFRLGCSGIGKKEKATLFKANFRPLWTLVHILVYTNHKMYFGYTLVYRIHESFLRTIHGYLFSYSAYN